MIKAKWTNFLILFLVFVICLLTINVLQTVPDSKASNGSDNQGEVVLPNLDDDDDIDPSKEVSYKAGDAFKAWNHGNKLLNEADGYKSVMNGSLNFGKVAGQNIVQDLTVNKWIYGNGNVYQESRSSGFQDVVIYTFHNRATKTVYRYEPASSPPKISYTEAKFNDVFGGLPTDCQYDINAQTFTETDFKFDQSKMTYTFTCNIHLTEGTKRYSKSINQNGKAFLGNNFPTFTKVVVTFTVNKTGKFVEQKAHDEYIITANLPLIGNFTTKCISEMTETVLSYSYQTPKSPNWL